MKDSCECCMMPFSKDNGKQESEKYCSHCFTKGKLLAKGMSLEEFQKKSFDGMRESGMGFLQAKFFSFCIRFAPYWKTR